MVLYRWLSVPTHIINILPPHSATWHSYISYDNMNPTWKLCVSTQLVKMRSSAVLCGDHSCARKLRRGVNANTED